MESDTQLEPSQPAVQREPGELAAAGAEKPESGKKGGWIKVVIAVLVVAGLFVTFKVVDVGGLIASFSAWVKGLGWTGAAVYVLGYIACTILFVPGTLITLAGGAIYGGVVGTLLVSLASTMGASFAFLIARYFMRSRVEGWIAGNAKFGAIDRAVGKQGGKIVLLTRLSPIFVFNLLNYMFGLTRVSFGKYVLFSWIGMLPGTAMFVFAGAAASDFSQLFSGGGVGPQGSGKLVLTIVGLVATIVVTIYVTAIARRALKDATGETAPAASG